ncbi:hypothetical protein Tco_1204495 [Tanacetum coccineum]
MQSSFLGWKSRDITDVECLMVYLLKLRLTLQRLEARYKYFPNTVPEQQIKNYDRFLEGILLLSNAKITPLFEKQVSASDVARIGRFVLQKRCAEAPLTSATAPAPAATQLPQAAQPAAGLPDMGSNASEPTRNDSVYESNVIPTTLLTSGQNPIEPDKRTSSGATSTPLRFKVSSTLSFCRLSLIYLPDLQFTCQRYFHYISTYALRISLDNELCSGYIALRTKISLFDTPSLVESNSPEFDHNFDIQEQSEEGVRETMTETMEQYMSKTQENYGSGVTRPTINQDTLFELKGQFLKELHDNTFGGSEHEDANEHIEKEVVLFYNGLDVPTRQILDSKGAIPSKTAADAKIAIQEMAEYS